MDTGKRMNNLRKMFFKIPEIRVEVVVEKNKPATKIVELTPGKKTSEKIKDKRRPGHDSEEDSYYYESES